MAKYRRSFWGYNPDDVHRQLEMVYNDHEEMLEEIKKKNLEQEKELERLRLENGELLQQKEEITGALMRAVKEASSIVQEAKAQMEEEKNKSQEEILKLTFTCERLKGEMDALNHTKAETEKKLERINRTIGSFQNIIGEI